MATPRFLHFLRLRAPYFEGLIKTFIFLNNNNFCTTIHFYTFYTFLAKTNTSFLFNIWKPNRVNKDNLRGQQLLFCLQLHGLASRTHVNCHQSYWAMILNCKQCWWNLHHLKQRSQGPGVRWGGGFPKQNMGKHMVNPSIFRVVNQGTWWAISQVCWVFFRAEQWSNGSCGWLRIPF